MQLTAVDGHADVLAAMYAAIADMEAALGSSSRELRAMRSLVDATMAGIASEPGEIEHLTQKVRARLAGINRRAA